MHREIIVTDLQKPFQITHLVFQEIAINLKYLNHCVSFLLDCSHARFTAEVK